MLPRDEEDINGIKRRISKLEVYINKYKKTLGGTDDEELNEEEVVDLSPADEQETENDGTNIVIDEATPTGDDELDTLLVEYNSLQR